MWRSAFARGGVEALKATVAPGPPPVKTEAAAEIERVMFAPSVTQSMRPKPATSSSS
jgi:hypothetical protein